MEDVEEEHFYVRERYYGVFRRSWTLPAGISEDDVNADVENGLLEMTVQGGPQPCPNPDAYRSGPGKNGLPVGTGFKPARGPRPQPLVSC